jgi:hypothetical protein
MSTQAPNLDADDRWLAGLLADGVAQTAPAAGSPAPASLSRGRLADRIAASARAHAGLRTARPRRMAWVAAGDGVRQCRLYGGPAPRQLRPGEPLDVTLVELAPGAAWRLPSDAQSEWLVLQGDGRLDDQALAEQDFHRQPPREQPLHWLAGPAGLRLYLRRSPPLPRMPALTSHAVDAVWMPWAPGVVRRTLWAGPDEAGYLIRAESGAQAPPHGHGHDEECFMLEGDLYIGDMLLCEGDFQLAPYGDHHGLVQADTPVLLYQRGDPELAVDV